jgi:hypothetical protein
MVSQLTRAHTLIAHGISVVKNSTWLPAVPKSAMVAVRKDLFPC